MANTNATREASDVKTKVTEGAKELAHGAKDLAHQIGEKADDATAAAGRGIQTVADKIRENAPDSGVLGSAARSVTDTIQSGGRYLENRQLSGMMDDFGDVIRNHPVPALLIAAGLGFLLARAMSRS